MITSIAIKAVLAGALILANAPADGGCAPSPSGDPNHIPGAPTVCTMGVVQNPTLSRKSGWDEVSAVVHVDCHAPYPQTHVATVWLDREVGGPGGGAEGWVPRGDQVKKVTIPDEAGFNVTIKTDCTYVRSAVRWRVMATAKGLGPSGTQFDFRLRDSEWKPTSLQCK